MNPNPVTVNMLETDDITPADVNNANKCITGKIIKQMSNVEFIDFINDSIRRGIDTYAQRIAKTIANDDFLMLKEAAEIVYHNTVAACHNKYIDAVKDIEAHIHDKYVQCLHNQLIIERKHIETVESIDAKVKGVEAYLKDVVANSNKDILQKVDDVVNDIALQTRAYFDKECQIRLLAMEKTNADIMLDIAAGNDKTMREEIDTLKASVIRLESIVRNLTHAHYTGSKQ
jgi:hypothetical protein